MTCLWPIGVVAVPADFHLPENIGRQNLGSNVLARHALWRYDNAFLQNENAIFSFQITLFSMSNNCLFGVMYNWVLQCHNWLCLA